MCSPTVRTGPPLWSFQLLPYRLSEVLLKQGRPKGNLNFAFLELTFSSHQDIKLSALQENCVSLWSIGDFGNLDSDGGFEGDHQLLCDIRHHGDVMDLQVNLSCHPKLTLEN